MIGDRGCGKHTLCEMIATKFGLDIVDITDNINYDTILNIYSVVRPTLFLAQLDNISIKE